MPKCPKCDKEISYLLCEETRVTELKATYDEEAVELNLEPVEEWRGNPVGEVERMIFACPECKMNLFASEEDAMDFLAS